MCAVADRPRIDHRTVAILGIETICVYGAWWYSYGVLLDPVLLDTGWSETAVASAFSIGVVLIGVGSVFGGRALDRLGSRPVFLAAAVMGGSAMLATSIATSAVVFAAGTAVSLGAFGALGFYHVSMTAAVRANPTAPARAIAVLTIWGALASAIFLPLSAWLVERFGWRVTIRVLAAIAVGALVLAAFGAGVPPDRSPGARPTLRSVFAATWRPGRKRGFTVTVALAGVSFTTILVYQVPVMVAAGLPLTTAATAAAVRGFCQLGGRVPLGPLIDRVGSTGAVMIALVALGTGGLVLTVAGTFGVALVFAITAGFGIGAWSPLQGIRAEELFEARTLGATMGLFTTVSSMAGALGPATAGVLADATGERRWGAVLAATAAFAALVVFAATRNAADEPAPAG